MFSKACINLKNKQLAVHHLEGSPETPIIADELAGSPY